MGSVPVQLGCGLTEGHIKLDAFVAFLSQSLDGLEHCTLTRRRGLDKVIWQEDLESGELGSFNDNCQFTGRVISKLQSRWQRNFTVTQRRRVLVSTLHPKHQAADNFYVTDRTDTRC
jgi:hypothetical protein